MATYKIERKSPDGTRALVRNGDNVIREFRDRRTAEMFAEYLNRMAVRDRSADGYNVKECHG